MVYQNNKLTYFNKNINCHVHRNYLKLNHYLKSITVSLNIAKDRKANYLEYIVFALLL